jgi:hypothetical protein
MIGTGKILLGVETLRCPLCGWPNKIEIHSDLPAKDWLTTKTRDDEGAIRNVAADMKIYADEGMGLRLEERGFCINYPGRRRQPSGMRQAYV